MMQIPIFDTAEEQAAYNSGIGAERLRQAREQSIRQADPSADLAKLRAKARMIVKDDDISTQDRIAHLRALHDSEEICYRFQEAELRRMLWDARRELNSPAGPIEQGGELHMSDAPWLWDGIIIRGVTNLITAPPSSASRGC